MWYTNFQQTLLLSKQQMDKEIIILYANEKNKVQSNNVKSDILECDFESLQILLFWHVANRFWKISKYYMLM